jgi:hypothetical protein
MLIDQYDDDKNQEINKQMDGSVWEPEEDSKFDPLNILVTVPTTITFISKSSGKDMNPIKEGLADTTLNILKACLRNIKNEHMVNVKNWK